MSRIDAVLPPLPAPGCVFGLERAPLFTIEQMRAYALQSFEQGRQQGMKQERALWELARSSEEIEPLVHPDGKSLVPSSAGASNTAGADALPDAGAPLSGFTRIPLGTLLGHDHGFYRWPECSNQEDVDPDTLFEVKESRYGTIELTAPGFGQKGDYGNGSILVKRAHWLEAWGVALAAKSAEGASATRSVEAPQEGEQ